MITLTRKSPCHCVKCNKLITTNEYAKKDYTFTCFGCLYMGYIHRQIDNRIKWIMENFG